ncbi:Outer membrane autotransporter barrel domain-containing protein [Burkholderiales bacterium 8X]|nr:Outer membrane autotransporter barrel domain-containing protein [Burkholderiales bacterium 8X]
MTCNLGKLYGALAALLLCIVPHRFAFADCNAVGQSVTCTGPATLFSPSYSTNANGITLTVQSNASLTTVLGSAALTATGSNLTLNNDGEIDPSLLGLVSLLKTGAVLGNGNGSNLTVGNTGTIRGTAGLLGLSLGSLDGMAVAAQNGVGGTTTFINSGTIGTRPLLGLTLLGADAPVVAAYGGARVDMTNAASGQIQGRVAFEGSAPGNRFVNAGSIEGSVSLGNSTGSNRFVNVVGSSVASAGGVGVDLLGLVGLDLLFASTGQVDGGNGTQDELVLQNSATGIGSGTTGNGTLAAGTYRNFERLTVNSGTWSLAGSAPLVSGTVALNGGLTRIGSAAVLGSGPLQAGGGALEAGSNLALANDIQLSGNGLAVQGTQSIDLTGSLSGNGSLHMNGSGVLTLAGANTYLGGTDLSSGTLRLAQAQAAGSGALRAQGGVLDVVPVATLSNDIALAGPLTLSGRSDLTLAGTVSGAGSLVKNGTGDLAMTGANSFAGGLALQAGRLVVGNDQALGSGTLQAAAGTAIDASSTTSLANAVVLGGGVLQVGGSAALALSGPISGAGGLRKQGAADLVLSGANGFTGGVSLEAGRLVVGSNSALGTGSLTASAGTVLDASAPVTLSNDISLAGTLSLGGSQATTLAGSISGAGGLVKNGAADVVLSGSNSFAGPVAINVGKLRVASGQGLGNSRQMSIAAASTLELAADAALDSLSGSGTLDIGASHRLSLGAGNQDSSFDGALAGAGQLTKLGTGTLRLDGAGGLSRTSVAAGRLLVGSDVAHATASLGGAVDVAAGASLGGTGTIGGDVQVANAATLSPGDGNASGSLRIGGSLVMDAGSRLAIDLGAGSNSMNVPGVGSSIAVAGDLSLAGTTVDVRDMGGYSPGLYRLFSYGGNLARSGSGLTLGSRPGTSLVLQYLDAAKQINLVNVAGMSLNLWNANGAADATRMGGGSGVWSATAPAWTDVAGQVTHQMQPSAAFAVFGGDAGTVTIDAAGGAVQATGMQFMVDGYRLQGDPIALVSNQPGDRPAIVVGDGTIASAGYQATIDSIVGGSAGIEKTGAGELVLGAANTYTGGNLLSAGLVSVASDAALGDAGNAVVFRGGGLRITGTGYHGTQRGLALDAGGGTIDIVDAGNSFTATQAMSGTGGLNKAGAGTLVLAADSTHTGGTTISAGMLQLGDGGTGGHVATDVVNHGVLAFDRSDAIVFPGLVSGTGSVLHKGSGSTTLSALNTYTGGTVVQAGTLVGSASSFGSGAIRNDATLVIDQATDATFANVLSGSGQLRKQGVGVLALGGDSSAFNGATLVTSGTLEVLGALGGTLEVADGAILRGTGQVGTTTLRRGARIQSARSGAGGLAVAGDLQFEPGSVYDLGFSSTHGEIMVSGEARIDGGTVMLRSSGNGNGIDPSARYRVLHAAGGITGRFDNLQSNMAFLTPNMAYDPQGAWLWFARNQKDFDEVATTPNEQAAADAADALPAFSPLYGAVVQLDEGSARQAFSRLGGELHASSRTVLMQDSLGVRDAALGSLRSASDDDGMVGGGSAGARTDGLSKAARRNVWARTTGQHGRTEGDGNAGTVKSDSTTVFVGADMPVAGDWRIGALGGYTRGNQSLPGTSSSVDEDTYHFALYGGKRWSNGIGLRLGAAAGHHSLDSQRGVTFDGFSERLSGSRTAWTSQVFGEVGQRFDIGSGTLEPFAGYAQVRLHDSSFAERGGAAALAVRGADESLGFGTLGLRGSMPIAWSGIDLRLSGMVGWQRAFGDRTQRSVQAFAGGNDFSADGLPVTRSTMLVEAGIEMRLARNLRLGVSYVGRGSGKHRSHGAQAALDWKF